MFNRNMHVTNNDTNKSSNNGTKTDNVSFPICLFCDCPICTWPEPSCKEFKDGACIKCEHDQKCLELVDALAAEALKAKLSLQDRKGLKSDESDSKEMLYVFLYFLLFFVLVCVIFVIFSYFCVILDYFCVWV